MMAMTRLTVVLALAGCVAFTSADFLMPGVRRRSAPREDSAIFFPGDKLPEPHIPAPSEPDIPEPDSNLDLPLDINELDVSVLNRLNTITNISAFADMFDLALPEPAMASDVGFSIAGRFGSSGNEISETFEMANCKPELVTVPLDLPVEANTMFFPTCIRLEQCGGCCFGPILECQPLKTEVVKVSVLKVTSGNNASGGRRGSNRGGSRGRHRRGSTSKYHTVEVVKHTSCQCGCKVRAENCNSNIHTYNEGECSCVCKNKDEKTKCEQQNSTKHWQNDTCGCYCKKTLKCGTGEYFEQSTCSCTRLSGRSAASNVDLEGPLELPTSTRRRRKPVRVLLK